MICNAVNIAFLNTNNENVVPMRFRSFQTMGTAFPSKWLCFGDSFVGAHSSNSMLIDRLIDLLIVVLWRCDAAGNELNVLVQNTQMHRWQQQHLLQVTHRMAQKS